MGYRFDADHRLEPVAGERELVVELFERRAGGASWTELEELLEERGQTMSRATLRRTLANRVYLGELAFGAAVKPGAHEAIVELELFEAVQARALALAIGRPRYDRAVRSLLAGIARCGTCGSRMRRGASGQKRVGVYACQNRACSARASIGEERLDAYVADAVLAWAGEVADEELELEVGGDGSSRAELERRLAELELALEAFATSPDGFGLEPAIFRAGVEARSSAIEELRGELDELEDDDEVVAIRTTLREAWSALEADVPGRRQLLGAVVDRIVVQRGTAKGRARALEPLEERVAIVLRDGRTL